VPGERDLAAMLATLDVECRPGVYTFVSGPWAALDARAEARIEEREGTTLVVPVDVAIEAGAKVEFRAAWLTVTVHSSLEAVGLTAALSAALASAGIACNMLAGYYHDHLLVPVERADEAVAAIAALASG
jgi:hypothetical protein